ncbi:MAG TPA: 16S rRNA (guanine(527)-N(7))-methyltransferase RsmG [Burkholderiales bacterium]|nr:16S rRNA (guanine(527)-N(7))-methyltransferase RsmG [Burkholderiales bacterium]
MSVAERILAGASTLGLHLSPAAGERMASHLSLIEKWNRVHNLTAVREPEQMVTLHVLDSLSLLPHLAAARSVVDVGTGPGFPGIPIAIARPDMHVTLLDSSHKKCAFLEQARTELGLANVEVVCERVEQWKPAQRFDAVVSRAFAELNDFVAQATHLAAPTGRFLAMKGVYPYDEIARVPASHRVSQVVELKVPSLDAKRHLVLIEAA